MKPTFPPLTPSEATLLIERYFEGQTTEAEEAQLKHFLATNLDANPAYDEARAVIGFAVARQKAQRLAAAPSTPIRRHLPKLLAATAAGLALFLTLRWNTPSTAPHRCSAHFYGREVTEATAVMTEVETTLAALTLHGSTLEVEHDLKTLFSTH